MTSVAVHVTSVTVCGFPLSVIQDTNIEGDITRMSASDRQIELVLAYIRSVTVNQNLRSRRAKLGARAVRVR